MRTKLSDRVLPKYTRGEEIFNMSSHIVGAVVGVVALVLCLITSIKQDSVYGIVASSIYGASLILLYTMSSIYHGLKNETAKKVFQVLDHCAIYLLIAGSYTPIALCALRLVDPTTAWTILIIEWVCAIIAITLTAIDLKKFEIFSLICYILMGWCIVAVYDKALTALTIKGFTLMLIGGILYTIGAILYGIGKRKKYMHNVFHIFVLLGSVVQFFAIMFFSIK